MPLFVGTRRILRYAPTAVASSPPTYFDKGTIAGSASTTSLSVSFPATVAANDIALIWAMAYDTITLPGTFTSETQVSDVPTATNFKFGWFRCAGSEGGTSVNVTIPGAGQIWSQIAVFSGCTTTGTPYEGYSAVTGSANTTSITTPGVTSTVAQTLGVLVAINNANITHTAASGYTEQFDNVSTAGIDAAFAVDTIIKETAGTTAAGTKTISSATFAGYAVFGLALMPA